ncbi:MAG: indolepyruvate ferredoxin oxidoreductase subunit alpha [Actinobacteria bacterium]|nr:indolepyruvate ferredoxin oxidoreductase subunit alpha [Actinomycetota bacterium]
MDNKKNLKLLTGNEAIARAVYEAGVKVAAAYPGTPSTEILENISRYKGIYCQWSVNEKVAMEVASGASIAGVRALVAMKHVGLNVAADPFMTLSYTGVNGGLVIISADDPYMHSSQNEQDNRFYAKFAKVPMLEPSDSQEALDMLIIAFEISEQFDTPVLLRTTTRISHSRSLVMLGEKINLDERKYVKDSRKYVMIPAYGRLRHELLLERWKKLSEFSEIEKLNKVYLPGGKNAVTKIGIITSGISYQYAREIFSNVPILKLLITNPLPEKTIRRFAEGKQLILIIEELEPFVEEQIKLLGLDSKIAGKEYFPQYGELNLDIADRVYHQLFGTELISENGGKPGDRIGTGQVSVPDNDLGELLSEIPQRPPVLCAGCPHRSVFYMLKKIKAVVMGDIGCYTLSVLPPLNALDSCLCMGAGIGQALGMEKAKPDMKDKVVSVIGDSTFFHSGITSLIDSTYNNGTGLIIILDNGTTAMTGHQVHPGVGKTLSGNDTVELKPEYFAKAAGVKNIRVVDPYDLMLLEKVFREELERNELSVIVCRRICALLEKVDKNNIVTIDQKKCNKCGVCIRFGCPAIQLREENYIINELLCTGCNVCATVCKKSAILKKYKKSIKI